jgi:CRISPR-associated protein Cst2
VNVDAKFIEEVTKDKTKDGEAVLAEVIKRCAVTDIAGTLITEGRAVARKSCVEFGWVVGIPDLVHSEQYFHVKYDPRSRAKSAAQQGDKQGEGTVAGTQAIFHRPANSGFYALVSCLRSSFTDSRSGRILEEQCHVLLLARWESVTKIGGNCSRSLLCAVFPKALLCVRGSFWVRPRESQTKFWLDNSARVCRRSCYGVAGI